MATIETLEAEINKLKADVKTAISKVEAETTPTAAEAAVAQSREGEVKTISPTEKKDEVKTAITKADEPVAAAKPKEAEVKVVVPAENKNEVKTIKADEPVATTAKPKEAEVKVVVPAENKNEVKTIKADEPVATAKPKEAEVKVVVPAENKNEVKTIKADEPVATAKPKEAEVKVVVPTENKARDAVEKVKTGAAYIGKAKFRAAICLAFLFGVAVGSFIGTYATRSSLGRAADSMGVSPSSAGRP